MLGSERTAPKGGCKRRVGGPQWDGDISMISHVVDECSCLRSLTIASELPELPSLSPRHAASCCWSIMIKVGPKFRKKNYGHGRSVFMTTYSQSPLPERAAEGERDASKNTSGRVKRMGDSPKYRTIFGNTMYLPPVDQ